MKKLLSGLVLVLLISSLAHSGQTKPIRQPIKKPSADPKLIRKQISVPAQRICMAVGAAGTVLTSSDDGSTWQVGNIGVNTKFGGLAQLSKKKFLAAGTHKIYRSADSGTSWAKSTFQSLTPDVVQTFNGVATDGATKVVAVGQFLKSGSGAMLDKGMIQYSTDGGATFQVAAPEVSAPVNSVAYTGDNRFVAAGGGLILYSTDGGASWNNAGYTNTNPTYKRPTATSQPAPIWNIADIAASTNGRVLAVGGGSLSIANMPAVTYFSTDGGLSWNDTNYSEKPNYIKGIATNKQGKWIAVGTNTGQYISSTDNGVSWSEFADIGTNNLWLGSVAHVKDNTWLAVGANGIIVTTSDNGANWTTVNTGSQRSLYDLICVKVN